jgi:hypothetical protein
MFLSGHTPGLQPGGQDREDALPHAVLADAHRVPAHLQHHPARHGGGHHQQHVSRHHPDVYLDRGVSGKGGALCPPGSVVCP